MLRYINIFIITLLFYYNLKAQNTLKYDKILVLGGIAHIGNGKVIRNSAIFISNGYIQFVKNQLLERIDINDYDTVIKAFNKHIYPSFIACNSILGITEIDAVHATNDFLEIGNYNPNLRTISAYNKESKIIETVKTNGILIGQITPRGGVISGKSSIVRFQDLDLKKSILKEDDGIHINWPKYYNDYSLKSSKEKNDKSKSEKELEKLFLFFQESYSYYKSKNIVNKNLKFDAMNGIFSGDKILYIHCNYAKEILQIIQLKRKFNLQKIVIIGGYDSWRVAQELRDNNISVILNKIHKLPFRADDDIDLPYKLPKLLSDKGILFTICVNGRMSAMNTRNLPFQAGTMVTYGLKYEKAVEVITKNAAEILGIEQKVGTLESGKEATFFISDGDALDIKTNKIELIFIKGEINTNENFQEKLFKKFTEIYTKNKYK